MTKYLKELRNRFVLLVFCWISIFLITYVYKETILFEILKSTTSRLEIPITDFMFTNVTELLSVHFISMIFISNQISILYFWYHVFSFIAPGLYFKEYTFFKIFFQLTITFWCISLVVLIEYVIPFMWNFFLSFQENLIQQKLIVKFDAKVSEYIIFLINLYYSCSLQLQLFVILILVLNYLNNFKKSIVRFRKFFYFTFSLIATFMTPPDIISQFLVWFSLILFFEITVLIKIYVISHISS